MTFNPRRFDFLDWEKSSEAAKKDGSTLIWPLGACEQHGPHLPLSTDSLFAERMLISVLDELPQSFPIWMLPAQSMGFSPEHASFPGTISLSAKLLLDLVVEVGEQACKMGFKRFVLFNAHGGQISLLEAAARELHLKSPSLAVLPCFLWRGVSAMEDLIPFAEREGGLHAGLAETSLMLALAPELVGEKRPCDGDHLSSKSNIKPPEGWSLEGSAPFSWLTEEISKSGVIGDSRDANELLGRQLEIALKDHWIGLFTRLIESKWPPVRG